MVTERAICEQKKNGLWLELHVSFGFWSELDDRLNCGNFAFNEIISCLL